jgi:hypothetical protein
MKALKTLLLTLLINGISQTTVSAKSIYYTYDNAGNRTGRIIIEEVDRNNAAQKKGQDNDTTDELTEAAENIAEVMDTKDDITTEVFTAKIYPNPTADILHIKTISNQTNNDIKQYALHSNSGNILLRGTINENAETSLNINNFAHGIYYLEVYGKNYKRTQRYIFIGHQFGCPGEKS